MSSPTRKKPRPSRRQPLKIESMLSPERVGLPRGLLSEGTEILSVNGEPVRDLIDFYFLTSLDERVALTVRDEGEEERTVRLAASILNALGIEFPPLDFRLCRNKCPFCFVDQNPKQLRPSLAIKDEDFRLSFIYGNYVTLNDITDEELERIDRQRLTPLYVSVHATDEQARRFLFGRPMKRDILDTLRWLTERGITIQGQIVVCPGVNDGEILDRTIEDLFTLYPGVESVSAVPVGLTNHREGLVQMRSFDDEEALECLDQVHEWQQRILRQTRGETRFIYGADEFYLRSPYEIPGNDYYGRFSQHDNGVGMARTFLNDLEVHLLGTGEASPTPDGGLGRMPGDFGHQGLWVPPAMPHPVHDVERVDGHASSALGERGPGSTETRPISSRGDDLVPARSPSDEGEDPAKVWAEWRRHEAEGKARTARVFTGALGAIFFERFVVPLVRNSGLDFTLEVVEVENRLFGPSVTCSGLLSGADMRDAIQAHCREGEVALIPPNTLNPAGLFVDDLTLAGLRLQAPCPVVVPGDSFAQALLSL